MGEAKRRREQTLGELVGLEPGVPVVLKVFSMHDVLGLFAGSALLDEEGLERLSALRAIIPSAAAGRFPRCLLCDNRTEFPSSIGYTRGARKSPAGIVFVICLDCSTGSEDLRGDILAALGEEEIATSTRAS
jgi:hypothetical protein